MSEKSRGKEHQKTFAPLKKKSCLKKDLASRRRYIKNDKQIDSLANWVIKLFIIVSIHKKKEEKGEKREKRA
jgi:hypothetical protein